MRDTVNTESLHAKSSLTAINSPLLKCLSCPLTYHISLNLKFLKIFDRIIFTAFFPFIFTFKLRQGQTLLMFQHSIQHVSLSFWIWNRFVAIIFGSNSSHKHLSLFISYLASKFVKNGFHPLVTQLGYADQVCTKSFN